MQTLVVRPHIRIVNSSPDFLLWIKSPSFLILYKHMDQGQFYNPKFTAFILALVIATVLIVRYPDQTKNLTEKILGAAKNIKTELMALGQTNPASAVTASVVEIAPESTISFGGPTPESPSLDNSFVVSPTSLKASAQELAQPIAQPLVDIFKN